MLASVLFLIAASAPPGWFVLDQAQPDAVAKLPVIGRFAEHKDYFAPWLTALAGAPASNECALSGHVQRDELFEWLTAGQPAKTAMRRLKLLGLLELHSASVCVVAVPRAKGKSALKATITAELDDVVGAMQGLKGRQARLQRIAAGEAWTVDGSIEPSVLRDVLYKDEQASRVLLAVDALSGGGLMQPGLSSLNGQFLAAGSNQPSLLVLGVTELAPLKTFFSSLAELGPKATKKRTVVGLDLMGQALFAEPVDKTPAFAIAPSEASLSAPWKTHAKVEAAVAARFHTEQYTALMARVGVAEDTTAMFRQAGLTAYVSAGTKPPLPKALLGSLGETVVTANRIDKRVVIEVVVEPGR